MKQENETKKIFVKSTIGFTLGISLLLLAYISIYFISDESTYINEINNLKNINALIYQCLFNGLSYYCILVNLQIIRKLQDCYFEHSYKWIFISIFFLIVPVCILLNNTIYSSNIRTINITIFIILYALYVINLVITTIKDFHLIKRINKKLKEKYS